MWGIPSQGRPCVVSLQNQELSLLQRFSNDHDLFNKKCALRSMIGALWLFLSPINVSPDQTGLILGLDHRTVSRLNEELVVGSAGADIELDEISFRSKPLEDKVAWAL